MAGDVEGSPELRSNVLVSPASALVRLRAPRPRRPTMNRKSNPATASETSESDSEPAFEQLLEELEGIVGRMEEGKLPLEETLREFERGQKLATACESRIRDATQRVQQLLEDEPGSEDEATQ